MCPKGEAVWHRRETVVTIMFSRRVDENPVETRVHLHDPRSQVSFAPSLCHCPFLIPVEPDPTKVRTWTDRSKSFSVEAQFLALKDGKINLHKMNGVKIAVPVVKMSVEDLEYVERITGISLDEDKPLSDIKKRRSRQDASSSRESAPAGATIEPKQSEYDWFQFFLSCEVAVGLCERYAQVFQKDSMDESVLPDVDAAVLRNLGIREGDIIKIMRFLDKKYSRTVGKRSVSFGGEELEGESSGGLFSGPGGTLLNNTRKGRPAPTVQTNDIVDAKAFSQDGSSRSEGVATPLASAPIPAQRDVVRSGFDDDAWDVKPSKSTTTSDQSSQPTPAPVLTPHQPALTGSMQELSLLSQPLEPLRAQPTAPAPQAQPQIAQQQQAPQGATPSFFQGIGAQQTGLPQQQTSASSQFNPQINMPQNIARQRPAAPHFQNLQGGLMIPAPPNRPLSAPQSNQNSVFAPPPLQPQSTGMQNSSGFQSQIATPGQSLEELRMRQQFAGFNQGQNGQQNMGLMPQSTGAFQYNNGMQQNNQSQNAFQYPMQTGNQQPPQQLQSNGAGPFADPRTQQFSPIQQNPTGYQGSFVQPQQQFPRPTGVNAFLPPPLQPTPTGIQSQNNGFSTFTTPPVPPMPQQSTPAPLVPQKTGPPPPVRFGVTGDTKKLMPQATGRRANLSQASKSIYYTIPAIIRLTFDSTPKPLWFLVL
jgi:DNA-directed RNA polymerase subunit H (RpoH/RPB5)